MKRDRVTFQSQLLYVGSGTSGVNGNDDLVPEQLQKVQLVSIATDSNRDAVDEFGRLAALGYSSTTAPVGKLRFQYFLGNGENENAMGFNTDGTENFIKLGDEDNPDGTARNFYLLAVAEKKDAVQSGNYTAAEREKHFVTSLGNGVLTNYAVEGAIGQIPMATVDWDAANVGFVTGSSGMPNPAINKDNFCRKSGEVTITAATTGSVDTPTLRPEDISLDFGTQLLAEGGPVLPGNDAPTLQEIYIRDFSIETILDTEEEEGLGQGPQSQAEVPIDVNFQCTALLTDVHSGDLIKEICNPTARDITVNLKPPCVGCSGANTNNPNMKFMVKGAVFDSQTILSTLDEPAMITLNFTTQLGAPTQTGA